MKDELHDGSFFLDDGSMFLKLLANDNTVSEYKAPRPPGRPKTRTQAHYAALLHEYDCLSNWFVKTFGRPAKSDVELLATHVATGLKQQGMRESRATSPDMKRKLKTLRNELSTARRLLMPHPENSLLPGCTGAHSTEMQERVLTNKDGFYAC
jgi:hypothetical protein